MQPIKVFFITLGILLIIPFHSKAEDLNITAPSAILVDRSYDFVLLEKNADQKLYPASLTKIMTCLLAVKNGKFNDKITVSKKAANSIEPGSSTISLKPNEIVTLKDTVFGLMLPSANECGNIIAEHVSGSIESFITLMNQTAKELGCTNTNFTNPHGLHDVNHYTTARDSYKISAYAMSMPLFRKISSTLSYAFPDTNMHKHDERGDLKNNNKMLFKNSEFYYPFCTGIKPGATSFSLNTIASSAYKDGHKLIAVILNEKSKEVLYTDTINMFLWGFQQYEKRLLIEKNIEIEQLKIKAANAPLILLTNEKLELNLPKMMPSGDITRKVNLKEIFLPLNKGDIIGTLDFYYNKKLIGKTDLISATDVLKIISWKHLKKYIITLPFLFGSACFLGLFFLVIAFKLEKRRNRFR